jgi:hypothetical protein
VVSHRDEAIHLPVLPEELGRAGRRVFN